MTMAKKNEVMHKHVTRTKNGLGLSTTFLDSRKAMRVFSFLVWLTARILTGLPFLFQENSEH